jgi:hypothetical protein
MGMERPDDFYSILYAYSSMARKKSLVFPVPLPGGVWKHLMTTITTP